MVLYFDMTVNYVCFGLLLNTFVFRKREGFLYRIDIFI